MCGPTAGERVGDVTADDEKEHLHLYLKRGREALLWKLDGVSEYDARRPLTPTGTNLLGLVKHVASVECGYLGEVFGRPWPHPLPWLDEGAGPEPDMFATADESRESIVGFYQEVWLHSDATVAALPLDAKGTVPWWGANGDVTLHRILVHMIAETHRHAGHADIVRETVDSFIGLNEGRDNIQPGADAAYWAAHVARVQAAADAFR
jgi:hypothetical protein